MLVMVFFFQAEDGIRDADVTGVQTCALSISRKADGALFGIIRALRGRARLGGCALQGRTYAEPGLQPTDGGAGAGRNRTYQSSSEPWTVLTDRAKGGATRLTPLLS